jgi:D-serine deaminase-like pyridoxal phosphate-dependent protein
MARDRANSHGGSTLRETDDCKPKPGRQKGMSPLDDPYRIEPASELESPGIVVFLELLRRNLETMLAIAGSPDRLRPHCKTHKTREIIRMLIARGVTRHKCATIAEAEMLLDLGVDDVFLAYQPVGPNIARVRRLVERFPAASLSVAIDHPEPLSQLADALAPTGQRAGVWMDLDPGMHRTGIEIGPDAIQLYEAICSAPGIRPAGLHWYDGHQRQSDVAERKTACIAGWDQLIRFRDQLLMNGLPVPAIVAGGTGSFPILSAFDEPGLELSPGTVIYFDAGYQRQFPDLAFKPALGIWTRVISKNRSGHVTLDVGHKACAADPPAGARLWFPQWADAREVQHTEEHLVVETQRANELRIGDATVAIPVHVCPTSALHDFVTVIEAGRPSQSWDVVGRRRRITL